MLFRERERAECVCGVEGKSGVDKKKSQWFCSILGVLKSVGTRQGTGA